ncbi:MAG TPA: dihydrodipicolinate synthase family protein [Blastocatellia bacterium]|nr:dihydrodipicolinate synthase family protein [Blastocatellia bacterium]
MLDSRGRVIEAEQRRLFRYNAQQGYGADIIFGVGTNGEWNRISNGERQRLMMIQADEIARINQEQEARGLERVEAWVGVTAGTRAETLANLECALDAGADAAVIAPLSITDSGDVTVFFQREVSDLFDHKGASLPIFLYDNAEIAVNPRVPHIRTRDVKKISRLPFIYGLKVSAPRRVLGNYTRGALHYKARGGFGIYIGDAMLMFQVFRLEDGLAGRLREYWNRYLLHNELPVGVVAGPANLFPREWQRAWRACYVGDERLMSIYQASFDRFLAACRFAHDGRPASKLIACLKYSLRLEGVIESDIVAEGTLALSDDERRTFGKEYARVKEELAGSTDPIWISRSGAAESSRIPDS